MLRTAAVMQLFHVVFMLSMAFAAEDGLALSPPMGWRSWNCFGLNITQQLVMDTMDRMVERKRLVDGVPMSLTDLGYNRVGLDDGWQSPHSGINGSFHTADGKPVVDPQKFPSLKAMSAYGHERRLKVDWYMNNCWSVESMFKDQTPVFAEKHMRGDVQALVENDFDGVKLDGCGPYLNISWWHALLNASGRPFMVENCHWGGDGPPCANNSCPFHFWRVSGDITNNWDSMLWNLQEVKQFLLEPPLARPGQWAYPDMLETGNLVDFLESRANFGLWAITSSPLILSFDLRDETLLDSLWPIIANPEAIAVSQAWEGHPGRFVMETRRGLEEHFVAALPCNTSSEWVRTSSWSLESSGSDGQLVQIYDAVSGRCADAFPDTGHVRLNTCNWTSSQMFRYDAQTGHIYAPLYKNNVGELNGCLDIFGKTGPRLQLTSCSTDPNQIFRFINGTWYGSGTDSRPEFPLRCLRVEQASEILHQVWSKPMPRESMAVLFVNSAAPAQRFNASMKDIRLSPTVAYRVRDIWARRDVGVIAAAGLLMTDVLKTHDTRFYLLTPAANAQTTKLVV